MRLEGKVAIVTGSAQGIGEVYARKLADEGASVVLVDIKGEEVEANAAAMRAQGARALAVRADLTQDADVAHAVARTVETFGHVDILVNNAALYAGYIHHTMAELPLDYWQRFVDINVTATIRMTQAVIPEMRKRGRGKIINQSSTSGTISGNAYGLTKLAVQGLTVAFARELAEHRINVNCIAPGVTATQATRDHYPGEALDELVANVHLIKRPATEEDHAWALVYLASAESDMVTGQILHTDGGAILLPI
ncbi:SDR family NAD(P)-dependent oxidoreductase [Agrococcus baldri]|uniref:Oxidoreductase n=1 Tax=Agrococcus baldri TaxID=153730 RepID=A0AA87UW52_9MICO|nr:SDR family oxidoreductase [Agrococcus baldri]GEK79142.1 putative oxidoreductase [Agrococcus baldri]